MKIKLFASAKKIAGGKDEVTLELLERTFAINYNPRMEISDIAEKISVSSKTVARRLEKMIENHVLDITIQINFTAIGGYIVSVV